MKFEGDLAPRAYRDEFWEKGGQRLHLPVRQTTATVECSHEALSALLTEAGYTRVPEEEW